ncbi:MAG: hypothetical protein ACYDCQ_18265, partial [Dehalococcoidia bacterium]
MTEQHTRETIAQELNRRQFTRGTFGGAAPAGLVLTGCSNNNSKHNAAAATRATTSAGSPAAVGSPAAARGAPAILNGSKRSFLGGMYYVLEGEA